MQKKNFQYLEKVPIYPKLNLTHQLSCLPGNDKSACKANPGNAFPH